jgi:serine/threonine protein phosphatase PrpC
MTEHLALVELARITDVGRVRGHNEDRHLVRQPLVAVADGMGGAQAGEVAAGMAVQALEALPAAHEAHDALVVMPVPVEKVPAAQARQEALAVMPVPVW